jgi:hypothetical protein
MSFPTESQPTTAANDHIAAIINESLRFFPVCEVY